jgi:hypothetical protein
MNKNRVINILLILAAIILSVILLWDIVNVQKKVLTTVEECNSFWVGQLNSFCPLAAKSGRFYFNISNTFNDPIVVIK